MNLASRFAKLGTETAFAVAEEARRYLDRGDRVFPFHLGDIDLRTPENIIEAAYRAMREGKTGRGYQPFPRNRLQRGKCGHPAGG